MKSAKGLLDSLMGPSRNLSSKQKTGDDFMKDNVCKCFLVGFCPTQQLSKCMETVEPCKLLHSTACKEELEQHPSASRYKRKYEDELIRKLEDICAEADAKGAKERRKVRPSETAIKLPDHLKIKIQGYEEARAARLKEADERGSAGDIEGSQMAMRSATQAQKDIDGINQAHTSIFPGEDVCKLSGVRFLLGGPNSAGHERLQGLRDGDVWQEDHLKSRVYQVYERLRETLTELRKKRREQESHEQRRRSRSRSKSRTRSRGDRRDDESRAYRDRERGGDRDRDRGGRNRDRQRRDRDRRSLHRDRQRSRSR